MRLHDLFAQYTYDIETHPRLIRFYVYDGLAALLNHNVFLNLGNYTLFPNIYQIVVGDSGFSRKSTGMRLVFKEFENAIAAARRAGMDAGMPLVANHLTVPAMIRLMGGGDVPGLETGVLPHPNKWGVRPAWIVADELTLLIPREAVEAKEVVTFLTAGYNGESFFKFTKSQGVDRLEKTIITMQANCTPGVLEDLFSSEFLTDGFATRTAYIYEEGPRHRKARPDLDVSVLPEIQKRLGVLTYNFEGPMSLSPEAAAIHDAYYYQCVEDPNDPTKFTARIMTHIGKYSMLLAAAEGRMVITDEDITIAIADVESMRADIPKLFKNVRFKNERPHVRFVETIVRTAGPEGISLTDLRRETSRKAKWEDVQEVLNDLKATQIVFEQRVHAGGRGRPTTRHIHVAHIAHYPEQEAKWKSRAIA